MFFDTRRDSIFSRYSPRFHHFRYSHRFEPFPVFAETVNRYSHGFYLFRVLAHILPFFGTHTNSSIFQYSPRQFFDTRKDSTFPRYSSRFYHFSVHTMIRPFFGTLRDSFSILRRISTFSGHSPRFYYFSVLKIGRAHV